MRHTRKGCLLLLISGILVGCDQYRANGQVEQGSQDQAPTNVLKNVRKSDNGILFKGQNITVLEGNQGNLKRLNFDRMKKSCLENADKKIKKALLSISPAVVTHYFEFEGVQTYNSGPDKFTVKFDKDLFSKVNPTSLRLLDEFVGSTIVRNLYLITGRNSSYLLAIGPESTTSGMGELYRSHLLLPLDINRPTIDFESISDDPRRIGIADSGSVYYTKIDPPYHGAVKESTTKSLRLTASLFSNDNAGNNNLETKFDFVCTNVEEIFEEP